MVENHSVPNMARLYNATVKAREHGKTGIEPMEELMKTIADAPEIVYGEFQASLRRKEEGRKR